ncbi:MAG: hypothetical protein EBR09_01115 [Proteobacteria bacterium]|nr:hypothetical protein [Pseudomonadota bacterium]
MLVHSKNASPHLSALISQFSGVRLAEPSDSAPLAQFINETSMAAGQIKVGFSRGADYYSLLKLQAEKYSALVCEDEGKIVGVGALTVRPSFVRGKPVQTGYFQDLRVSPAAGIRTRQNFYKCFSEFVRVCPELPDFGRCSVFTTAILDDNIFAKTALSRANFPLEYARIAHYTAHMWPKALKIGHWLQFAQPAEPDLPEDVSAFYEAELGRMAFDLTQDDLQRLRGHSRPVVLREGANIIAACLLVQTDAERRLHAEHSKFKIKFDSAGTFITALRVAKKLEPQKAAAAKKNILGKAIRTSMGLKGLFTGYIESDEEPLKLSPLQELSGYRTRGSLYRVFHPEHARLNEFSDGFLRPNQIPCFEWITS